MRKDLHLQILKYVDSNHGCTETELIQSLNLTKEETLFVQSEMNVTKKILLKDNEKINLTFEGKNLLLKYDELQEARRSSEKAMWVAILALLVNAIQIFQNYGQ